MNGSSHAVSAVLHGGRTTTKRPLTCRLGGLLNVAPEAAFCVMCLYARGGSSAQTTTSAQSPPGVLWSARTSLSSSPKTIRPYTTYTHKAKTQSDHHGLFPPIENRAPMRLYRDQ